MRALIVLALLVGCKDKDRAKAGTAGSGAGTSAAAPVDWATCDAALARAHAAPAASRPQLVIDGCRVCGDWTPILRWNTPQTDGGPTRGEIEEAMLACDAYCSGEAKLKFLGTLDKARGTSARTPWRQLGDICKDQVSALPDQRFMSAPYFALDRIARAVGRRGGETARLAGELELPLPAVTVVGTGVALPELASGVSADAGDLALTLLGDSVHLARLPRARLGASGVTVELDAHGYPGRPLTPAQLGAALTEQLGAADPGASTVTLVAPSAMAARALVPVIAATAPLARVRLAALAHESPAGWPLVGTLAVALEAGGDDPLVVTADMTVQQLATVLALRKHDRIGIIAP
jgi:hypothetical protein